MINLNSGSQKSKNPQSDTINEHIDAAIVAKHAKQERRKYLGASSLGKACSREIQYEYLQTPREKGFSGRVLRIFALGHNLEDKIVKDFRNAGYDLRNEKNGEQFGFSTAGGKISGHIDGVLCGGPEGIEYPALWECKTMAEKKYNDFVKNGVAKSHPVYAAQVAMYQAYMNLTENPAVLTSVNKNTSAYHHEIIPFNPQLAQETSDKAVNILQAGDVMLPRISDDPGWWQCRFCDFQRRCHGVNI